MAEVDPAQLPPRARIAGRATRWSKMRGLRKVRVSASEMMRRQAEARARNSVSIALWRYASMW